MNKKFIYYFLIVVILGALPKTASVVREYLNTKKGGPLTCTQEAKICPDGSTVFRNGPTCEFTSCPVIVATTTTLIETQKEIPITSTTSTTSLVIGKTVPQNTQEQPAQKIATPTKTPSLVSKITSTVSSFVTKISSSFQGSTVSQSGNPNDNSIPPSSYITPPTTTSVYKTLPPENFAGQKYLVKENNILSNDNKVIYTIPPEIIATVTSSQPGWTNTIINVVPVGTVAPILNAIPITDLPGKYYLSENSFGNMENCEFSNKIFILDIYANTATLMYEENNQTLPRDDPRACNSEIFLLATEGSKLVLKYHTIGTNTLCDSTWSEPEKTFYLDVVKLRTEGMKKYSIPENLTTTAEQEEAACRNSLQSP